MDQFDFNEFIHAERTKLLAMLPKGAKTFCSAGCSGRWYFDWVEETYGPLDVHIGVELYSPKPPDLPPYVTWLQNSVASMQDVATGSVDVLFSGQNVEHISPDDLKGFLLEANRVIRHGGLLCIDSPNRAVTLPAKYIQPEHLLELTVDEAVMLASAAGFAVVSINGIWLCQNEATSRMDLMAEYDPAVFAYRKSAATKRPRESFIWWMVARKIGEPTPGLTSLVDRIFLEYFPGFVRARFSKHCGRLETAAGTEAVIRLAREDNGTVFYGPYVPLSPGRYSAEFLVRPLDDGGGLAFDVCCNGAARMLASDSLQLQGPSEWRSVSLGFTVEKYTTGIETRLHCKNASALVRFGSQILPL